MGPTASPRSGATTATDMTFPRNCRGTISAIVPAPTAFGAEAAHPATKRRTMSVVRFGDLAEARVEMVKMMLVAW